MSVSVAEEEREGGAIDSHHPFPCLSIAVRCMNML